MDNFGQPVRYLTFEDILIVAQRHVDNYHLLRENQLRYLVQMVGEKLDDKELFPTLPLKAAFYAHHIIAGHIFLDGNKRIGLDCALWFLTMNGCSLPPRPSTSLLLNLVLVLPMVQQRILKLSHIASDHGSCDLSIKHLAKPPR